MPLPQFTKEIESAVTSAFDKVGITNSTEAQQCLNEAGATVARLCTELANLVFSSKDVVKQKAIMDAFALHGIRINTPPDQSRVINIQFNVVSENTNLNNLFAPER